MAKIKIDNAFAITGRGYILSGDIIGGKIAAGNSIHIGLDQSITIKSVESVNLKNTKFKVGLMIGIPKEITLES